MLKNSRSLYIQNVKNTDLITNNLEHRRGDADALIRYYLSLGYTIYDVVAEGGFGNLQTNAIGTYLVVWIGANPTGTYIVGGGNFALHTGLVITGIRLDSSYNVISYNNSVNLDTVAHAQFDGKNHLTLAFINSSIIFQLLGIKGIVDSTISTTTFIDLNDLTDINNSYFTGAGQIDLTMAIGTSTIFTNCKFNINIYSYYSTGSVKFVNCLLSGTMSLIGFYQAFPAFNGFIDIIANNLFVDNSASITLTRITCTTGNNIFNVPYNAIITGSINALNILRTNILFWYDYKSQLTTSYFTSTAGYTEILGTFSYQRKSIRGFLGTIKRNFYYLQFDPVFQITDSLKYNDDNDLMLVWRSDLETELSSTYLIAKIKNYQFYKTDGTTLISTYRNAESFLMLVQRDSTSAYTYMAWHKGEIWSTIYGETWLDSLYTIVRCFHILEFPEEVSFKNLYNYTNSPMEATYLMQDATSKVVTL